MSFYTTKLKTNLSPKPKEIEPSRGLFKEIPALFWDSQWWPDLPLLQNLPLAQKKVKPPIVFPKEFSEFAEVFSKEATDHIPPSWPYDHEINLDKTFVPKIGKIYLLSPDKKRATEDFLKRT